MKFSFQARLVISFFMLMIIILGNLFFITFGWIENHIQTQIQRELEMKSAVLRQVHNVSTKERFRQLEQRTLDSRIRALATVKDMKTLEFAAKEQMDELSCSAFAFLSPDGEVRAWNGKGEVEIVKNLVPIISSGKEKISTILFVENEPIEIMTAPIRMNKTIECFILASKPFKTSILNDYSYLVGSPIELWYEGRPIVGSYNQPKDRKRFRSFEVPLYKSLRFVLWFDVDKIAAPLYGTLQTLGFVGMVCVLVGTLAVMFIARWFSRPIEGLVNVASDITKGKLSVRAKESGAPEMQELAKSFNEMTNSLLEAQDKLSVYAHDLEKKIDERTNELRQSERRTRTIIDSALDGIITINMDGIIAEWNPKAEEILGWSYKEVIGRKLGDIIIPLKMREAHIKGLQHYAKTGEGPVLNKRIELPALHKDGHEIAVELAIVPIKVGEEQFFSGFVRDLTETKEAKKKLEEAQAYILQSEKLASIGQLAAGVAHEINNPVGFVMSNLGTLDGYSKTWKKLLDAHQELANAVGQDNGANINDILVRIDDIRKSEDFDFIQKDTGQLISESLDGTNRIKEIVQGLKSFARLDESEVKEVDIHECINTTLKVVWNELKYKCEVEKKLAEVPRFRGYPGQINQVFMNLLVNAAQAIPERGKITIETKSTDHNIIITVSDTGKGILQEHLKDIFNPFFTTKPVGKGTGLGLAIVYGIIEKHNGTIDVESEVGKGTTFTISLPLKGVQVEK